MQFTTLVFSLFLPATFGESLPCLPLSLSLSLLFHRLTKGDRRQIIQRDWSIAFEQQEAGNPEPER